MDIRTYNIEQLPDRADRFWMECCAHDRFASPFFHPEFVRTIDRVRQGVRVAVISDGEEPVGIFPYERDDKQRGGPVAGRLSDFQGLICRCNPNINGAELLEGCGLRSFNFDHWLAEQTVVNEYKDELYDSPFLDLSQGFDAYYQKRISQSSTRLKKIGQLSRKLERECGSIEFVEHDRDPKAWELLIRWKRDQYRRTGALDIFKYRWVLDVLQQVAKADSGTFRGCMMTYRAADRIVAVHLGMRTEQCVHWWFPAYDPAAGCYSPGLLMLTRGARHFAEQGVLRIDLGKGDEPYKKSVTLDASSVAQGMVQTGNIGKLLRRSRKKTWERLKRVPGKTYFKRATALIHRLRNHYDFR